MLALSAAAGACAQENPSAEDLPFVGATRDHMLEAVGTCETARGNERFDIAQVRAQGWRRLSPPGGMPDGQSMFANRPSGASITISASEAGPDKACVIIGWVDDQVLAQSISTTIADELGLTLEAENDEVSKAQLAGWTYTIGMFTKPDVTSQIRMIVVIAPSEDGANS